MPKSHNRRRTKRSEARKTANVAKRKQRSVAAGHPGNSSAKLPLSDQQAAGTYGDLQIQISDFLSNQ